MLNAKYTHPFLIWWKYIIETVLEILPLSFLFSTFKNVSSWTWYLTYWDMDTQREPNHIHLCTLWVPPRHSQQHFTLSFPTHKTQRWTASSCSWDSSMALEERFLFMNKSPGICKILEAWSELCSSWYTQSTQDLCLGLTWFDSSPDYVETSEKITQLTYTLVSSNIKPRC